MEEIASNRQSPFAEDRADSENPSSRVVFPRIFSENAESLRVRIVHDLTGAQSHGLPFPIEPAYSSHHADFDIVSFVVFVKHRHRNAEGKGEGLGL